MTTTAPTTTSKPRRHWLQFRRRTLLVLICALSCGWLAWKVKQAREQREAVVAIHEVGGEAEYEWSLWIWHSDVIPSEPPWPRRLLGDDLVGTVKVVRFPRHSQVTDADLMHLTRLPQLWWLQLNGHAVSDAGLDPT
jgi:hypothetical protein